jgi:U3 small nucleolar RNA-associated protein MPP10
VRFNDQVRVKIIKSKGKGLPVNGSMEDIDIDDENGLQMEFEDMDDIMMESEAEQSSMGEYGDIKEVEEGHATIERLKDDLFAEEDRPDSGKVDYVYFDASFTTWLQI